jgi:uncharacterized PurR-regulated membrane protein YhhQ (DUF165 family)
MTWAVAYLLSIVGLNWAFVHVPMVRLPWGDLLSLPAFGIGVVYLLRDAVQRVQGRKVVWWMLAGIGLTLWLASPAVALASGLAFACGEGIEAVLFEVTKRPFRQRVLWSAAPSIVADTVVFLLVSGYWTWSNFAVEVVVKSAALVLIRWMPDPLAVKDAA